MTITIPYELMLYAGFVIVGVLIGVVLARSAKGEGRLLDRLADGEASLWGAFKLAVIVGSAQAFVVWSIGASIREASGYIGLSFLGAMGAGATVRDGVFSPKSVREMFKVQAEAAPSIRSQHPSLAASMPSPPEYPESTWVDDPGGRLNDTEHGSI